MSSAALRESSSQRAFSTLDESLLRPYYACDMPSMSMGKSAKALLSDLAVDGACTAGQAVRNRGAGALERLVASGLARVDLLPYKLTARSREAIRVPVVRLTGEGLRAALAEGVKPSAVPLRKLAHAVGMSELRTALGLDALSLVRGEALESAWVRAGVRRNGVPDGLFVSGHGVVALEYDHGRYGAEQVAAKLEVAPLVSDRLVWGVPSEARARWLLEQGALEVLVLRVPLWPGV